MGSNGARGRSAAVAVTLLGLVALLAIPAGAGADRAVVAPGGVTGSAQWAFGATHTVSKSGTALDGNSSFTLHASLGWSTIMGQSNTSSTTIQVEVTRTIAGSLSVQYCRPDCSRPVGTVNISERAWQTVVGFTNFTTVGNVSTPSGPVRADAVLNSSVEVLGNLTESVQATYRGPATTLQSSATLDVATNASARLSFSPALGLLPTALGSTPAWSSSASYRANGSWSASFRFVHMPWTGPTQTFSSSPMQTQVGSGSVSLTGRTGAGLRLSNGVSATSATIDLSGPFSLFEGFILVPSGADLFGPSQSSPWGGDASGLQSASTSEVDVGGPSGHLPIDASSTSYEAASTDQGAVPINGAGPAIAPSTSPTGLTPLVVPAYDGPGTTSVQGEPETVPAAQASSACLLAYDCPGSTGPGGSHPFALTFVLVGAFVAVLVVAALLIARQPPRTVPASPNATLYPPEGSLPPPPAPGGPRPSPGRSDDPLRHLW